MQRIALATLLSVCLAAGESPRAKIQVFGDHVNPRRGPVLFVIDGGQTYTTEDQPKDQNSWGLRFSFGLDDESRWNLELAVRAKKKSHLTYAGPASPTMNVDFTKDGFEYGWWGPGASYALNLGPVVAIHAGLDYRIERITYFLPEGVIVPEGYSETTIYNRPWARVGITFTLPVSSRVKPFVGGEGAVALVRKKVKTYTATQYVDPEDMRRGLTPDSSVSVFAGISF